ncbi:hypothetical protein EYR38_001709 [Pleurotus pulmonarius]|nr:hypothetical protein EYR38_001709 [Pleurotus pulmonarius]
MASDNSNIDPVLLALGSNTPSISRDDVALAPTLLQPSAVEQGTPTSSHLQPSRNEQGEFVTKAEYANALNLERRKQPLKDACATLKIHISASANLERLRAALVAYPEAEAGHDTEAGHDHSDEPSPIPTDEAALIERYGLDGADAQDLLGFGDDDDEDEEEEVAESFDAFQTRVRLDAVKRTEGNRREGGLRTQQASVRLWNEWVALARSQGKIRDNIVDEHSLLLFIQFSAERCKRTRRGVDIPNTFVGASQLKKLFFADVTEEQMAAVGDGFIQHRELRSCIYGHVAWVTQTASGNRGDDLRALKLAELQPWVMLHPNSQTAIECILGLQSEEKAGKRGMRTIINPVYTVWIAHRDPVHCPLGAFALLMHFLHDVKDFTAQMNVDWSVNTSWRQARVLSGPNAFDTPFSDQSLYNLYVKAFDKADFISRVKAHLPCHILGYKQEQMGVDPSDTAQLGWEGSPVDLQRLENELLQQSLESIRSLAAHQASEIRALRLLFERRTSALSPTQGFSVETYHQSFSQLSGPTPISPQHVIPNSPAPAVYITPDSTLRAHVNESPKSPGIARSRTQVDLVLPPIEAFSNHGAAQFLWPPLLGQKSVNWHDVFPLIKQPNLCWTAWKPSKTLDQYKTVKEVYDCYALGEAVYTNDVQTGVKPPLRLVEQHFQFKWRNAGKAESKAWQRFREIPEYIDSQASLRKVSPDVVIEELEDMRCHTQWGFTEMFWM